MWWCICENAFQNTQLDLDWFHDKTHYMNVFGPDKCEENYKWLFVLGHKNPGTGVYEEKHAKA